MTALIESQVFAIIVMTYCGMTVAIVYDVFTLFIKRFAQRSKVAAICIRVLNYVVIGSLIADFIMYCQSGKITFSGGCALAFGLWLWRKLFYDTINAGERNEQKGETTQRIRKE